LVTQNGTNKRIVALDTPLAAQVFDAQSRQISLIPLIGGDDPTTGKRPVLPWKAYQTQQPTLAEVQHWLDNGLSAYGIVCGQVSGIIVLDIDDSDVAVALANRFPRLMNTYTVRSGMRGTPHIYWHVDFPVKSQSVLGGDLKAEGSYVVGAGSEIAGRVWQIENDSPIWPITQAQFAYLTHPCPPLARQSQTRLATTLIL
jgi:hypothetical protein